MDFMTRIKSFGDNEPIFIEELKRDFSDYSRAWLFAKLRQLTEEGKLVRFDVGVYYVPTATPFGTSKLNPEKVIKKRFVSDNQDIYGFYSGLTLENAIGLTTQVPNVIEVVSNKESAKVRDIKIGYQTVRARRSKTLIDKENVKVLQLLDLLKNITMSELDSVEHKNFIDYVKKQKLSKEEVIKYSTAYPAVAMKNLMESGAIYELA